MSEDINEYAEDRPQVYEISAVPVHIESTSAEPTRPVAPEFGSCFTFAVNVQPAFTQLLSRRYHRSKAKLVVVNLNGATKVTFNSNRESAQAGVGFTAQAVGPIPDWESQQPLYASCDAGTGALVAVIDEAYAA